MTGCFRPDENDVAVLDSGPRFGILSFRTRMAVSTGLPAIGGERLDGKSLSATTVQGRAVNERILQQDNQISVQIVDASDGHSQLRQEWDDLFVRARGASPYLSRAWAGTFIQEERISGKPLLVAAWCDGKLAALLPLAIRRSLGTMVAEPIGTGQPSYLGLLLDPDYPRAVERIAETIRAEKVFQTLCIEDLWSGDEATNKLLTGLAGKGFSVRRVYRNPCPYIRLACSYEEYIENTKSPKSRQTLLRKERRLQKKHTVDVEYYHGAEITAGILARVASVQEQSWMKTRGAAVLGQPFYRKLLPAMAHERLACAWMMTIDGADAAFVLALVAHKQLYYAWTAFDLKYASSLSVGQFLTNWTIRHACHDGIEAYDFIHGDAQYKQFWSTDSHSVHRAVAGRGLRGRCLMAARYMSWRLARVESLRLLRSWFRKTLRGIRRRAGGS